MLAQVTFDNEPRRQYLRLLGYDTDELAKKVRYCTYNVNVLSTNNWGPVCE